MSPDAIHVFRPQSELRAQVAVIGSGPGGAITACLLAEAGCDVLLIEEGPLFQPDSCPPFSSVEMEQKYRNGGLSPALGAVKVAYAEGRCVGGGSEINSGLYHRTPSEILDRWRREFQLEAANDDDLRPHFETCERDLSVSGSTSPVPPASLKLEGGAISLGWKSQDVPRWFKQSTDDGAGTRQSMTRTFIPRFVAARGKLLPDTRVDRLRRDGKRWILRAAHASGPITVHAETVFVCGGAIQTPALLRRSGITANVGNTLQMHPTVKTVAMFDETVNEKEMGVPVHQVKEFAPQLSFGCSISSLPHLALTLTDHPSHVREVESRWMNLAIYYAMITTETRGTVRSVPGFKDPLVRYSMSGNDLKRLSDGLRKLSRLLFAAGARKLFPAVRGLPSLQTEKDLTSLPKQLPARDVSAMTVHLFSSCPMGEDRKVCATDSFGRVFDQPGLQIADGSLLCTAPGVNPQGSIMAFARRNALKFLENVTVT